MTERRIGFGWYFGAAALVVVASALAQNATLGNGNYSMISAAYAQQGQGRGSQGGGGSGIGGGGAGSQQGIGGQRGGSGGSGVRGNVLHGNGGGISPNADEESDRPAWAGTKGGKSGGGTKPGTAGTKKGDTYGDMYVILRDANGVPILDQYGHVQYLDAQGNLIALDAEGTPLDASLLVSVELSRLSSGRSPTKVLDRQYTEAIDTLNNASSITLDSAGRLVVTNADGTTTSIDSPLANLALYKQLLSTGYLPGLDASKLPSNLAFLANPSLTSADFQQAADFLGAASDKTGKVSIDTVAYLNSILGVAGTITTSDGKLYVNYSSYTYDRASVYGDATATVLVKQADGTYVSKTVNLYEAVFNNTNEVATNIDGFSQASDDARAVILYLHDNGVPTSG